MTRRQRLIRLRPALGIGVAMMTVWGLVYSFPLFVADLSDELHVERVALAGIVVGVLFFGSLVGPPLGVLVDRIGPRPAILLGIVTATLGFAAFSQVHALWQAYVAFAGVLGIGQMLIYLGATVLIARSFATERATAFGIAYAGLGIGTGVYALGGQVLIAALGWRSAALIMAFTPLLVIPLVLRLQAQPAASANLASAPIGEAPRGSATLGAFALILGSSVALGLVDEGVYQNLLPHAVVVGFDPTLAALALTLVSLSYVVGQLVGGAATDRYGPRRVALVAFALAAAGMLGVVTADASAPFATLRLLISTLLYGAGLAVLLLIRLATFADRFAGPRFGFLSGIFALAYPVGGSAIVFLGGLSFDLWRSYLPAFGVSAAGLLATIVLLLTVMRPLRASV